MKDLDALEKSVSQVTHASQLRPIVAALIAQVKVLAEMKPVEGVLLEAEPDTRLDEYRSALDGLREALDALSARVEALEESTTAPEEKKALKKAK